MKSLFNFILTLANVDEETEGLEEILYEAGCDDALLYFRDRTAHLEFDREAPSLREAILSAVKAVEATPLQIKVVKIQPDDLVSPAEVARRLHKSREAIRKMFVSFGASPTFPRPVATLNERSSLWSWYKLVGWLNETKALVPADTVQQARLLYEMNRVLEMREEGDAQFRMELLRDLEGRREGRRAVPPH